MAVPGVSSSSCGAASPASPSSGRLYKHAGLTQKIRRERGKRQQSLFCNEEGLWHQVTGCSSQVGFRLLSTPCLSGSIPPMSQGGTRRRAVAWATKDPARTRAGPNLHSLQHSSGSHDCKYLVLPKADRSLRRSIFLPIRDLLSLHLSAVPACSPSLR